jgi:hydroxylamine reductase
VSYLQNLLVYLLKGISIYGTKARDLGVVDEETDLFVAQSLFATVTNVNFDPASFVGLAKEAIRRRDDLRERYLAAYEANYGELPSEVLPDMATWRYSEGTLEEFERKGAMTGTMVKELDEDVRSLRELLTYGLKGLAAYTEHAYVLGYADAELLAFLQEGLVFTINPDAGVGDLLQMVMTCGKYGVQSMALLDQAHTERYGHPEPTQVNLGTLAGPGILISGHDLRDLEELLEQTEETGINIYTHGEMLPAHAYPAFKKYSHLVGNYGGAWWEQQKEFRLFNGPILMTTNCIQKPHRSYADRIFTTGMVEWPSLPHIAERKMGQQKDFSPLIAKALDSDPPTQLEEGTIPIGFAHQAVVNVADVVVDAVQNGEISRFVVMAGCDGHDARRRYYTDVALGLPEDTVILTAGCAKYRYNKLGLGDIGGIPRVLDAGQCNDSYSLVVIAQKLAEAFALDDINELPISYDIAWYEQKAVIVLLALLYLGVKHIRLGPTLPAFLSPNVVKVLVENFDLKPIDTVESDLAAMMAGQ